MEAQFGQEKRIQDYHDENKNVYMYIQGQLTYNLKIKSCCKS